MIPKGWQVLSISQIAATEKNAIVDGPFGSNLKLEHYRASGIPVIQSGFVTSGKFIAESYVYVEPELFEQQKRSKVEAGDLVMAKIGAQAGKCAILPIGHPTSILAGNSLKISVDNKKLLTDFLRLQLAFNYELNGLQEIRNESAQPAISLASLKSYKILSPPIDEQLAICKHIMNWDSYIDLTERLIAANQDRRAWVMQQLLTGKRRLPGFESSSDFRKTPFGFLPSDWAYPRIGEVAKEVSERNGEDAGRPVLSCTKHKGLVDSLAYFGKQIFSEDLSNYKLVRKGQFAYATNHIDEGSIGYQDAYEEALISPIYTVFQTNETIDDRFLFLVLKTETYRHIFASNTSASVDRRGSLRWSDFAKIHIPRPSIAEQQAIVRVIDTADRELDLLRAQLDALREQKKGLMQQLLTGKIRLKV